jgi:hypothetical protein
METGLFHVNEHFNLNLLEEYIEEHPEDAEKWLIFLENRDDKILQTVRNIHRNSQATNTLVTPDLDEDLDCNVPDDYENVCLKCKRTWTSTPQHLTTSLLCGHKYHTACWLLHAYENDDNCIFEGCGQSTYRYVRDLCRRRERMKTDTVSVLTNAVCNKREFKLDIKKMKRQISSCMKSLRILKVKQQKEKNNMMKKHIFSIREIQTDMNAAVKNVSKCQEKMNCLKEVKAYRGIERYIFRKYHLSLRDLMRKKIIGRMNWRVRSVLERHGRIGEGVYKFGVRIYPGSKKWNVSSDEEVFSDSDSEVEDLPGTE